MHPYAALGCLFLALTAGLVPTRPAARPAGVEFKIGIVDIDEVLESAPAARRASQAFDASRKAKQDALDKQQGDIKQRSAELERQKATLGAEQYDAQRKALEQTFLALQQTYVKLERELAQDRTQLVQELMQKAKPEIEKIAKAETLSVVFDRKATLWSEPALDLTQRVREALK